MASLPPATLDAHLCKDLLTWLLCVTVVWVFHNGTFLWECSCVYLWALLAAGSFVPCGILKVYYGTSATMLTPHDTWM